MSDRHHYRAVYKSDHLAVADIEELIEQGSDLVFKIKYVRQEFGVRVAGKKGDFNIAYFEESIKPWVINAGTGKILRGFCGGSPIVEDWGDVRVRLYIDPSATYGGEVTGGVRLHQQQPPIKNPELLPNTKRWDNAKTAFKRDGNLNKVKERMIISKDNELLLIGECQ